VISPSPTQAASDRNRRAFPGVTRPPAIATENAISCPGLSSTVGPRPSAPAASQALPSVRTNARAQRSARERRWLWSCVRPNGADIGLTARQCHYRIHDGVQLPRQTGGVAARGKADRTAQPPQPGMAARAAGLGGGNFPGLGRSRPTSPSCLRRPSGPEPRRLPKPRSTPSPPRCRRVGYVRTEC
jgi:hypothetical protein